MRIAGFRQIGNVVWESEMFIKIKPRLRAEWMMSPQRQSKGNKTGNNKYHTLDAPSENSCTVCTLLSFCHWQYVSSSFTFRQQTPERYWINWCIRKMRFPISFPLYIPVNLLLFLRHNNIRYNRKCFMPHLYSMPPFWEIPLEFQPNVYLSQK